MNETQQLLREYSESGSERAFQELVRRYIDLVYSVAIRRVGGNFHRAEDVVQTVFTDLARKAPSLAADTLLGGWLHRHCCFVASNLSRAESRRTARDQEAALMSALDAVPDRDWEQISPALDDAIQALPEADRDALVMRFFEKLDLRSVGAALGTSEDAAQKRVSRALEKLRHLLVARGVTLSIALIEAAVAANAVAAAPSDWASRVGTKALESAALKTGMVASLLAILSTTGGKLAATAAALLGLVVWQWPHVAHFPSWAASFFEQSNHAPAPSPFPNPPLPAPQQTAAAPSNTPIGSNTLRLTILSAETGEPLAKVPLEYRAGFETKTRRESFATADDGVCFLPIPDKPVDYLTINSRIEGYADTRLCWYPRRGQPVPEDYILKLLRATPISGTVVDFEDKPVSGAEVGFNHREDPVQDSEVESPLFGWVSVQTDEQGRWRINHIADSMIRHIYGGASHSEHVNSSYYGLDSGPTTEAEAQLRAGTHIFRLGAAVTVRGVVVESSGNPIANAKVLVGRWRESGSRSAVTELDGTFEAKGCRPGETMITAEAPQYAPTTIIINPNANSEAVKLVLARGAILKMRVVDSAGRPVSKAGILLNPLDPLRRPDDGPLSVPSQANFNPKTDEDGRVFWDQAPDMELTFDVYARGYMRSSGMRFRPDGREHTIVLTSALKISGRVNDAETGTAISSFKLVAGSPERSLIVVEGTPVKKLVPYWSPNSRFWMSFGQGKFETSFEDPVVGGGTDPEFIFKIEAEGYAPFISRVIKADEGSVSFDAALAKASALRIRVLQPDGQPAGDTDLALVGGMQVVQLSGRRFERGNGIILTTDDKGEIAWQPDDHTTRIIAAGPSGFAETTPEALRANPVIQLQGWGRIEGTFAKWGKPVADLGITMNPVEPGHGATFLHLSPPANTDAQGRFVIANALPGDFFLSYYAPAFGGNARSYNAVPFRKVNVIPGETVRVNYDERGTKIQVRAIWPEGLVKDPKTSMISSMKALDHNPPKGISGDRAALTEEQRMSAVREIPAQGRFYLLGELEPDRWTSPEVVPGEYVVSVQGSNFRNGSSGDKPRQSVSARKTVIVPEDWSDEIFDAGDLVLQEFVASPSGERTARE